MLADLTLHNMEGGELLKRAQEELQVIVADVEARLDISKARTLTVEVRMTPRALNGRNGAPTSYEVEIECDVRHKVPGAKGMKCVGFVLQGKVKINDTDPSGRNPYQMNIEDTLRELANKHGSVTIQTGDGKAFTLQGSGSPAVEEEMDEEEVPEDELEG